MSSVIHDPLKPFEGPLAAIETARDDLADFELRCKAFIAACDYLVIPKEDPKTGEKIIALRFSHRPPPVLRARAMNILAGTRHALDQAVCDAAIALGRSNSKNVYFPVGINIEDLDRAIIKKCKNVHPSIIEFLRACKPYYGGNDIIRIASEMAGNKHSRIIQLSLGDPGVRVLCGEPLFEPGPLIMQGPLKFVGNKWSRTSNELEYVRIGPGGYFNMNIHQPIEIVLGEGHLPFNRNAATCLSEIIDECEHIILGLKAETEPILRSVHS